MVLYWVGLSCYRHNCNINCTEYYCIEHTIQLMLLNYMKVSTPTYVLYVEGDDEIKCD